MKRQESRRPVRKPLLHHTRKTLWTVSLSAVGLLSVVVYWMTACRTITWWESPSYSLAASCMGIVYPPGSLLLTILGGIVVRLPLGLPGITVLNGLAGLLGALTAGVVTSMACHVFLSTLRFEGLAWLRSRNLFAVGAVLGGLAFAFSDTLWEYALTFAPYVLTPLFTTLILWGMIRWWENAEERQGAVWLLLIGLLIGLDFSVHRTNAVLIPGLFFWLLIRYPRVFLQIRSWLMGFGGLIAGLAFHLLIIPMSAADPRMNACDPSNFARFWDYVSLKQQGGGFLIQFFPRKAPFWGEQVGDFLTAFANNFFSFSGDQFWLGVLVGVVGLIGLVMLWRSNRRFGTAWLVLFVVTASVTILYFNIPSGYFRSLHRHYLPCMVLFSFLIAYGSGYLLQAAFRSKAFAGILMSLVAALLVTSLPVSQLMRNYPTHDLTGVTFAHDTARNFLCTLPQNSILIVSGDNDTFPLWYLQGVEGFRDDVEVININLLNTTWYLHQILRRDPGFPLSYTDATIDSLHPIPWQDSTITVAITGTTADFDLPDSVSLSDSLHITVPPSIPNGYLLVHDQVLLDLVRTNRWRRPLYFAQTLGTRPAWVQEFLRPEGYVLRMVPMASPPLDVDLLKENLTEKYVYNGWADPTVPIDEPSKWMAHPLYSAYMQLAQAQMDQGDRLGALVSIERVVNLIPLERGQPVEPLAQAISKTRETLKSRE